MSNNQNNPPPPNSRNRRRNIAGPTSALTDYLASNNISASDINRQHQTRVAAAQQAANANAQNGGSSAPVSDDRDEDKGSENIETQKEAKRKAKQQLAIMKIKETKKFKNRKRNLRQSGENSDDMEDDDALALSLMKEKVVVPGQQGNCAKCQKRFTVTPYSRANFDGGLLCNPCGKELEAEDGTPKKKKRKARSSNGPVGRRRTVQSAVLDGSYQLGAKDLMTLCAEHMARNIHEFESLAGSADHIVNRMACILAKRRLLDSQTINLFLEPTTEDLRIYDAAKLSEEDLKRVFQTVSSLKKLRIRNGIQFTDEVMGYMLTRNVELTAFALHGANLLSGKKWVEFFKKHGASLDSLKISYTDKHVTDKEMEAITKHCPSLQQLKICHNQEVSGNGVKHLGKLKKLQQLGLQLQKTVHPDVYVTVISTIGSNLETLSLAVVPTADNTVLDAIHTHCRNLSKLRLTESEAMTDEGFVRLFSQWENQPLRFLDLEKCRHIDSNARDNPQGYGLCSNGFKAMMAHSGSNLRHLNIESCRHISADAFEEVFAPGKTYKYLQYLEISFCAEVTDFIVGSIFRSCPNLNEIIVFGCIKVKEVRVPRGKFLIGVPNALGMQMEGNDSDEA